MDLIFFDLQLFAEGGAAAPAGAEVGVTSDTAGQNNGSETVGTPTDTEERAKAYAQFKTDYKAEYDAEVQGIVKDRVKKSNAKIAELNGTLKSHNQLIEAVAKRYGLDSRNLDALTDAFLNDDTRLEEEAMQKGLTVEQLKAFNTIERENIRLREAEKTQREQMMYAEWDRQAAALQQIYPTFDMPTELENEQFCRMLNAGVDVRNAYELVHKDEIMRGAMQFTAQKAAEKVANAVIANKARPSENGVASKSGSVATQDIAHMSREQIEDYKRRALSGERITFNR